MADLNIAETPLPQDGRISLVIDGREVDLRVSIAPDCWTARTVVLRVLDKGNVRASASTSSAWSTAER